MSTNGMENLHSICMENGPLMRMADSLRENEENICMENEPFMEISIGDLHKWLM